MWFIEYLLFLAFVTFWPTNMNKTYTLLFCVLLMLSCTEEKETIHSRNDLKSTKDIEGVNFLISQGQWLGQLKISENKAIPFNFEVIQDSVFITNSDERIGALIKKEGDSLVIKMPVFDSEFHFTLSDYALSGFWHNYAKKDYKIPFSAEMKTTGLDDRFNISHDEKYTLFDGEWETIFSKGKEGEYKAIGVFNQDGQSIVGTFITQTGDYRFLQGNIANDSIFLSCFDGSHAFLFQGTLVDGTINGMFYSGSHWSEPWVATKNELFTLANPYSLTNQVKEEKLEFTFPNLERVNVSYPNEAYKNKVVIIQVLGSWCPNCMDETKFLTELHKSYQPEGLEIIGLAFEIPKNLNDKITRVKDLKSHFDSKYEFLIAGNASKKEAEKALPALSEISSFPTTIFIDKKGAIRKIHTGFYGPGTGAYYTEYVSEVKALVEELLNE